jgi:hypothetical protein
MVVTGLCLFPRIVDCFPPLKPLPGCSVRAEQSYSSSLTFTGSCSTSSSPHVGESLARHVLIPSIEEDIAIPSGMPTSTKQSDLPCSPPPPEYWKLKKLDPSANVMDYWIKSSKEWDLEGIESDIAVCVRESVGIS